MPSSHCPGSRDYDSQLVASCRGSGPPTSAPSAKQHSCKSLINFRLSMCSSMLLSLLFHHSGHHSVDFFDNSLRKSPVMVSQSLFILWIVAMSFCNGISNGPDPSKIECNVRCEHQSSLPRKRTQFFSKSED